MGSDPSDRFTETLPCGCEYFTGQWFPCAAHATPHGQHTTYCPSCDRCQDALDEAREAAAEREQVGDD